MNIPTEKTKKKMFRSFHTSQTIQRCCKSFQKLLNVVCRRHIKHGLIWNKESYLSVCVCWTICLRDPFLLWSLSACAASNLTFFLWKIQRLLQTSCNEGEKRKKWTEQEMMTQLYGNHFRTQTGDGEPMTTSTLVQIQGEKLLKFSLFQSR